MRSNTPTSRLVYSTDTGRVCPDCGQAAADCRCKALAAAPKGDGIVRVSHETKGRKGKGVTVVRGVLLDEKALVALGKQLKSGCGSGGTTKDGVIEIQGDHCDAVLQALLQAGHSAKRSGG